MSYADPLGQCQDALANIFYYRRILRLHRDKAIGNHCPKQESDTRSLGEIGFFIAADMFPPVYRSLFSAPKISFGNGTTTSSTVVDNWLMLTCCWACAPCAHKARSQMRATVNFKCLVNSIIGSFEC